MLMTLPLNLVSVKFAPGSLYGALHSRVYLSGTPTFFIGKIQGGKMVDARRIVGAQSYEVLARAIDSYLLKQ
jgi:hypothetical protein